MCTCGITGQSYELYVAPSKVCFATGPSESTLLTSLESGSRRTDDRSGSPFNIHRLDYCTVLLQYPGQRHGEALPIKCRDWIGLLCQDLSLSVSQLSLPRNRQSSESPDSHRHGSDIPIFQWASLNLFTAEAHNGLEMKDVTGGLC